MNEDIVASGQGLRNLLLENGASEVGFARLSGSEYVSGISILLRIPAEIVRSIADGPNMVYFDQYHILNDKLDELATSGARYISKMGFNALAMTTDKVEEYGNYMTELPHKTVATLAGLGWIGKSALLVTPTYGSAIRLTTILTDMPLEYGTPVKESACGNCTRCESACPGMAISGKCWNVTMQRDEFFDVIKCRAKARQLSKERMDKAITLCGKCIEVCPYTQKYIGY
jgi:epoxyqueuosine reductase